VLGEIIAVYRENQVKQKNMTREKNAELLNIKAYGIHTNHCALNPLLL
jgi:hypothetical protein